MQLLLPGASDDQAAAGVEAARIFLLSHGLVAEEAAAAFAFVEAWDDAGALDEERPSAEIIHAAAGLVRSASRCCLCGKPGLAI